MENFNSNKEGRPRLKRNFVFDNEGETSAKRPSVDEPNHVNEGSTNVNEGEANHVNERPSSNGKMEDHDHFL